MGASSPQSGAATVSRRDPPRTIALVGLRASGKTTVGAALAQRLGWPFVDSDARIAAIVGRPAGAWLAEVGEQAFRDLEEAVVLAELAAPGVRVLATGGGAVLRSALRVALRAEGCAAIWLLAPEAVLLARLLADPTPRPALSGAPDLAGEVRQLASARGRLYAAVAHWVVDATAAAPALAATIAAKLGLV